MNAVVAQVNADSPAVLGDLGPEVTGFTGTAAIPAMSGLAATITTITDITVTATITTIGSTPIEL